MIMDYLGLDQLTAGFGFVTMLKAPAAFIGPPFAGSPFAAFTIVSKIKANKKSMLYALIIDKHRTYKVACILIKLEFEKPMGYIIMKKPSMETCSCN